MVSRPFDVSERAVVRAITVTGDDILHRPCREVTEFGTTELAELIEDMVLTMHVADGAGLAANQVGVGLRLFVYDCWDDDGVHHTGHLVNPVLDEPAPADRRLVDDAEGCLSVPGATVDVPRTDHAVARGFDQYGEPVVIAGNGQFGRCLQHETDHLDGRLYLDRLSRRDRREALRQMADRREHVFALRAARAAELGR
ncbi:MULTISPECIES: peptide deformylase [unclassified Streptomyces]|uniref:peptide deformylase n=1 Tax=unclassified Streptomyces TaxID=2593676 RepID=UPI0033A3E6B5